MLLQLAGHAGPGRLDERRVRGFQSTANTRLLEFAINDLGQNVYI